MASIVLREPRIEQPPLLVGTDWANPIFAGVSASIVGYGAHQNWIANAGQRIANPTVNGVFSTGATPIGAGTRFNGSSNYYSYPVDNVPADEFTLLMGIMFDALSGVTGLIDVSNGSTNGWSLFTSSGDMYLSGNHYGGDLAASGWATNTFYHLAARNKLGVGKAIFRNGVLIASDATSLIGVSNPVNPLWLGRLRVSGPQYMSARVAYCYLIDKYLSDAAIASVAANAWQALEPEHITLVATGVAVAQTHTLAGSAATQGNAASTAAVAQTHALAGSAATQGNVASIHAVAQTHALAGSTATQGNAASTDAAAQTHALAGSAATQSNAASTGAILQQGVTALSVAPSQQGNASATDAIAQLHMLMCAPSIQDAVAAASPIVQSHVLAISGSAQANVAPGKAVVLGELVVYTDAPFGEGPRLRRGWDRRPPPLPDSRPKS